jgi:nicotinamidase-related amidase
VFVLLRAASDVLLRLLGVSQGVVFSEWGSEHHCYRVVFLGAACSNVVVCTCGDGAGLALQVRLLLSSCCTVQHLFVKQHREQVHVCRICCCGGA